MNRNIDTTQISFVTQLTGLNTTEFKDTTPYKEPAFAGNKAPDCLTNLEVAGLCVTKRFILIVTTKCEIIKYMFDEQDITRVKFLPLGETTNIQSCTVYADLKGYHCFVKINLYYFYVNLKYSFVKLLNKLTDHNFTSVAFNDANSTYNFSGFILFGSSQGVIYGYSVEYDHIGGKLTEKLPIELLKLKTANPIFGIAVSLIVNDRWNYIKTKM